MNSVLIRNNSIRVAEVGGFRFHSRGAAIQLCLQKIDEYMWDKIPTICSGYIGGTNEMLVVGFYGSRLFGVNRLKQDNIDELLVMKIDVGLRILPVRWEFIRKLDRTKYFARLAQDFNATLLVLAQEEVFNTFTLDSLRESLVGFSAGDVIITDGASYVIDLKQEKK